MKRIIFLILAFISIKATAQNWETQSQNVIQRKIVGTDTTWRSSIGANRFIYFYNKYKIDQLIAGGGSSYIFNNGLNNNSGTVGLGGDANWSYNNSINFTSTSSYIYKNSFYVSPNTINLGYNGSPDRAFIRLYNSGSESVLRLQGGGSYLNFSNELGTTYNTLTDNYNKGLYYGDKYRGDLTNRWIPDKEYVDSVANASGGGSSYTFNNGLNESGGVVGLEGNSFWPFSSYVSISASSENGGEMALSQSASQILYRGSNKYSGFSSKQDPVNDTEAISELSAGSFSSVGVRGLRIGSHSDSKITFYDAISNSGAFYESKYRSNLTNRWIPDKEYVDSVANASGGGSSPTIAGLGLLKSADTIKADTTKLAFLNAPNPQTGNLNLNGYYSGSGVNGGFFYSTDYPNGVDNDKFIFNSSQTLFQYQRLDGSNSQSSGIDLSNSGGGISVNEIDNLGTSRRQGYFFGSSNSLYTNRDLTIIDQLNLKGAKYPIDYSKNWTAADSTRLATKDYVDRSVSGSGGTTANNGLTKTGNNIALGGNLIAGSATVIGGTAQPNIILSDVSGSKGVTNLIGNGTGDGAAIAVNALNDGSYSSSLSAQNLGSGSGFISFDMNTLSGTVLRDDLFSTGIKYYSNYAANFTARSLVDKGYVDAAVAGAGGGAVGANPTATAGPSAVNGTALTFMRSDAAPKVDSTATGFRTVANSLSLAQLQTRFNAKANVLSGTTNNVPKFSSTSTLGASNINDDGTTVTINGGGQFDKAFRVNNNSVSSFVPVAEFYALNNSTAGNIAQLRFGVDGTTNNAAEWQFQYNGFGSTANQVRFGFMGGSTAFYYTGAGVVNLPNLTATTTLGLDASKNVVSITNTGTGNAVRAASPALTGTPTAPTAAAGTNTTQIATTAFAAAASNVATISKTANYTIVAADFAGSGHLTVFVNATSGAVTITLPSLAIATTKQITIFKTDSSANVVTISGAANINSAATYTLPSVNNSVDIYSNNTIYYAK